jgi:hypothetical protein
MIGGDAIIRDGFMAGYLLKMNGLSDIWLSGKRKKWIGPQALSNFGILLALIIDKMRHPNQQSSFRISSRCLCRSI